MTETSSRPLSDFGQIASNIVRAFKKLFWKYDSLKGDPQKPSQNLTLFLLFSDTVTICKSYYKKIKGVLN